MKRFAFAQLSESAKEKVRQEHCTNLEEDWAEYMIEDWKEQLVAKGFKDPEINYSGFCCQGDGASFTARVERALPKTLADAVEQAKTVGAVLHRLSDDEARGRYEEPTYEYSFRIERNDHHYVHQYTISATGEMQYFGAMPEALGNQLDAWHAETLGALTEEARGLSGEIYDSLHKEYDYQTSDEYIAEQAENNDQAFDEDGELVDKPKRKRVAAQIS